ncbi:MAG: redox-regulated ATPase YchF [Dehalococcoidia bacterium]|nr:redox-regulated ATPase YchF [Dehalococcoidia bacterium]
MLQLGIVGFPQSGKTTLLAGLTGGRQPALLGGRGPAMHAAVVKVPDHRLDHLGAMYPDRKRVHAEVEYVDFPYASLGQGDHSAEAVWIGSLRTVDALVAVVRTFDARHPTDDSFADLMAEVEGIQLELVLADLPLVERRLERLETELGRTTPDERTVLAQEQSTLIPIQTQLEASVPLRALDLDDDIRRRLRGFQFLSAKPILLVVNIGEQQLGKSGAIETEFVRGVAGPGTAGLALCAQMEMELAALAEPDRRPFMEDFGISELAAGRVIRASYQVCGLRTFFTVGDEEVRAWSVPTGTLAPQAAGLVHTDMEKGFIRAEVVSFDTLFAEGDMAAARRQGLLRQEGRSYAVSDGDVVHFLFSR